MMPVYIRFTVDKRDAGSLRPMGVFQAASELKKNVELTRSHHDAIDRIFKWFNENLPTPDRFSRSRRPNAHRKAISWFKESAADCLDQIRELNSS